MITLGVRDLAAAIEFYEKGLGIPRMKSPPEVAVFGLNGTWLGLYGREALAENATVSPEGEGFESFTLAHNVSSEDEFGYRFFVSSREETRRKLPRRVAPHGQRVLAQ
jgi:catechol 2,3-dioxygenase-like lactoylglutathione lyase family enzyme